MSELNDHRKQMKRHPDVLDRMVDGELVLYQTTNGAAAVLDPLGTLIWQCLADPASVEDLTPDIAEAFEISEAQVGADLLELFQRMATEGFLVDAA